MSQLKRNLTPASNMTEKESNLDSGYKLIPMSEITPEARRIAVRWGDNMKDDFISQKHKLASDIMNYARRHSPMDKLVEWLEGELSKEGPPTHDYYEGMRTAFEEILAKAKELK